MYMCMSVHTRTCVYIYIHIYIYSFFTNEKWPRNGLTPIRFRWYAVNPFLMVSSSISCAKVAKTMYLCFNNVFVSEWMCEWMRRKRLCVCQATLGCHRIHGPQQKKVLKCTARSNECTAVWDERAFGADGIFAGRVVGTVAGSAAGLWLMIDCNS